MRNTICVVFPPVGMQSSIKDGTLRENVSQLEAFNCLTSYLTSIKLHLRCLIGFYSKCESDSCSVWHCEDASHCQLQPHSRILAVFKTNCLAYRYRYQPKFFNWLQVFLEKVQTTSTNQNFIICCWYFCCCYLFVSLWHCSHMSLSYLSSDDGLIFFCFSFCGALGLMSCLKCKKQRGATHFLVWWGVTISPTCMHISVRIFGWMVRSLN